MRFFTYVSVRFFYTLERYKKLQISEGSRIQFTAGWQQEDSAIFGHLIVRKAIMNKALTNVTNF
jgi:hypothetical protein